MLFEFLRAAGAPRTSNRLTLQHVRPDEGSSQSDHLKTATEKMAEKEVHAKRRAFEQEFRVQVCRLLLQCTPQVTAPHLMAVRTRCRAQGTFFMRGVCDPCDYVGKARDFVYDTVDRRSISRKGYWIDARVESVGGTLGL